MPAKFQPGRMPQISHVAGRSMNTALKLCREDSLGYTCVYTYVYTCLAIETYRHPRGKHNSTPQISVLAFNKLAACCVQTFIPGEYKAIQSRQDPNT